MESYRLIINMSWPFSSFTQDLRRQFRDELSKITGLEVSKPDKGEFIEGCTIFILKVSRSETTRILMEFVDDYKKYYTGKSAENAREKLSFSFFRKFQVRIVNITSISTGAPITRDKEHTEEVVSATKQDE